MFISDGKMKFTIIVVLIASLKISTLSQAKSIKKLITDSNTEIKLNNDLGKSTKLSPIIAIQIVNSTDEQDSDKMKISKNSKRTISTSLGYGYQNQLFMRSQKPRLEVYKYSQQDIPPSTRQMQNILNALRQQMNLHMMPFTIQKSLPYSSSSSGNRYEAQMQGEGSSFRYMTPNLKDITSTYNIDTPKYDLTIDKSLGDFYQPGTTLFSTMNQNGQLGQLSPLLPYTAMNHQEPQVPVIFLKIMPNQLNQDSPLHANLPDDHPLASSLNFIDLKTLLKNHVENLLESQDQQDDERHDGGSHSAPQPPPPPPPPPASYQSPSLSQLHQMSAIHSPQHLAKVSNDFQQQILQYYQPMMIPQQSHLQQSNQLLTFENFPKPSHTRVSFNHPKGILGKDSTLPVAFPEKMISPKTIEVMLPQNVAEIQIEESDYQPNLQNHYQSISTPQHQIQQPQPQQFYYGGQGDNSNYYVMQSIGSHYMIQPQVNEDENIELTTPPFNYHAHRKRDHNKKQINDGHDNDNDNDKKKKSISKKSSDSS